MGVDHYCVVKIKDYRTKKEEYIVVRTPSPAAALKAVVGRFNDLVSAEAFYAGWDILDENGERFLEPEPEEPVVVKVERKK